MVRNIGVGTYRFQNSTVGTIDNNFIPEYSAARGQNNIGGANIVTKYSGSSIYNSVTTDKYKLLVRDISELRSNNLNVDSSVIARHLGETPYLSSFETAITDTMTGNTRNIGAYLGKTLSYGSDGTNYCVGFPNNMILLTRTNSITPNSTLSNFFGTTSGDVKYIDYSVTLPFDMANTAYSVNITSESGYALTISINSKTVNSFVIRYVAQTSNTAIVNIQVFGYKS